MPSTLAYFTRLFVHSAHRHSFPTNLHISTIIIIIIARGLHMPLIHRAQHLTFISIIYERPSKFANFIAHTHKHTHTGFSSRRCENEISLARDRKLKCLYIERFYFSKRGRDKIMIRGKNEGERCSFWW